jgi:integrase
MKNFTRVNRPTGRIRTFRLIDDVGEPVRAFDLFVNGLAQDGHQAKTVETYSNHVASFLDYLTEARVFGFPSGQLEIMNAIKSYLPARLAGANARGAFDIISRQTLGQKKLKKASAKNHAAAINKFLFESDNHALHLQQIEDWEAGAGSKTPQQLFPTSPRRRTSSEIKRICQSSMLVNVMNYHPTIAAGKYLKVRGKEDRSNRDKDFPLEYIYPLLDSATYARDEALWALQAGTGLRPHEAVLLQMDQIDFTRRTVVAEDPDNRRFASQMPNELLARWKGRAVSETYFIPSLRDRFFRALERYIRTEYMPHSNESFVFQSIKGDHKPYALVSDKSRIQSFHRACLRLQTNSPAVSLNLGELSPHSLRHFYGTYMLNYVPVGNGQYGLRPVEVQRLMGHEKLETTMKYARQDKVALDAKILMMNSIAMNDTPEIDQLVKWVADKYSRHADCLNNTLLERRISSD